MWLLGNFIGFIVYLASTCGYIGVFILNILEYACLPFPSEIVLPAIGASAASGKYNVIYVLLISVIGGVVGILISYSVGKYAGQKVILFIETNHKKSILIFEKINRLFSKYGKITVFLTRLLPFTRTYISIFAGAEKVNKILFVLFSTLGIIIMDSFYVLLGYFAYDNKALIEKVLRHYSIALIIIVVTAIFSYYIYRNINLKKLKKENWVLLTSFFKKSILRITQCGV